MARRLACLLVVMSLVGSGCGTGPGDVTVAATDEAQFPGSSTLPAIESAEAEAENVDGIPSVTVEFQQSPSEEATAPVGTVVARAVVPSVTARVDPDVDAAEIVTLSHPTDRGGARVFEVITPYVSPVPEWLEVWLPIRPNGSTGWIRSADVELGLNPFRVEIDTSDFELVLFRDDEEVLSTPIAVGTGDTPTPYGRFFITELLQPSSPNGPYGPYAFGLSGFSEILSSFAGGEGVIGIHGTDNPSAIGTNVSFGCVRVDNDVIETMASMVPLGTPVEIQA